MPETKRMQTEPNIIHQQKTAIYCRVSTREQGESGLSIASQRRKCENYCDSNNFEVVKRYEDVASAKDLNRPRMQEMLHAIATNEIEGIVCLKLDRLTREPYDFYKLQAEFKKHNIELDAVEESADTSDALGNLHVGMMLNYASYERNRGIERTRDAMRQKALQGEPGGGVPPLGYDKINKELIVNTHEAEIVKKIFISYLHGDGPTKISKTLTEKRYKNKTHTRKNGVQYGGKDFTKQSIHKIISNPLYKGVLKSCGEHLKGKHIPIISEQDWDRAQELVALNAKSKNLGNSQRDRFLLTGITRCGVCGELMSIRSGTGKSGARYDNYTCISATRNGQKRCSNSTAMAIDLEAIITRLITLIATSDDFFKAVEKQIAKLIDQTETPSLKNEIARMTAELREIKNKVDILIESISTSELLIREPLLKALGQKQKLHDSIQLQREKSKLELKNITNSTPNPETFRSVYNGFMDIWDDLNPSDQRDIIRLLICEIEVNIDRTIRKGNITVTLFCEFPATTLAQLKVGSYKCDVKLESLTKNKISYKRKKSA